MDIKIKYRMIFVFFLAIGGMLFVSIPRKDDYIKTPSTHEDVVFLEVGNETLPNGSELWFALYDLECDHLQICLSFPKSMSGLLSEVKNMKVYVDNIELPTYKLIIDRSIWKNYLLILIDNVDSFQTLILEYEDKKVRITR